MKQWWILIVIILLAVPFIVAFGPSTRYLIPDLGMKLTFIQTVFSLYAFFTALIGVWEYVNNSRKHIEPQLYLNNRLKEITLKATHFPCHVDLTFQVLNNGNISIEKTSVNYTILLPQEVHLQILSGVKNEVGKEVVPGHRAKYEYNTKFQALGGEVPVKVFPQRLRKLFVLNMVFPRPGKYILFYYFTTDAGFFPKNIILDQGNEPVRNLGKLILHVG